MTDYGQEGAVNKPRSRRVRVTVVLLLIVGLIIGNSVTTVAASFTPPDLNLADRFSKIEIQAAEYIKSLEIKKPDPRKNTFFRANPEPDLQRDPEPVVAESSRLTASAVGAVANVWQSTRSFFTGLFNRPEADTSSGAMETTTETNEDLDNESEPVAPGPSSVPISFGSQLPLATQAISISGISISADDRISQLEDRLSGFMQLWSRQNDTTQKTVSRNINQAISGLSGSSFSVADLADETLSLDGLTVTGSATSTYANGIDLSGGCFAVNGTCIGNVSGSGITSLGALNQALTAAAQTFATSSDTNIGLTIVSSGSTHTFTPSWIGTLAVGRGGTGWSAIQAGTIPYGNGSSALATTSAGTAGNILALLNGVPTWTATTTFGSGLTYSGGAVSLNVGNANTWTALQQFAAASTTVASSYNGIYIGRTATTSIVGNLGTSTFSSFISAVSASTTATSTFAGINLPYGGCIAVRGTCLEGLSGTLTVAQGGTGATSFPQGWIYSSGGTTALAASTSPTVNYIFATSTTVSSTFAAGLGIGTTSPFAELSVNATAGVTAFAIGSTTDTHFVVDRFGNIGISSTTPSAGFKLSVDGSVYLGSGLSDALAIHAGSVRYVVQSTTTLPLAFNAYSIASTTANANDPVFNVSFSTTGASSTIGFFVSTSTGLNAGAGTAVPSTMKNYVFLGNGKTQAGMSISHGGLCVDNDGWCAATTSGVISAKVALQVGNSDLAEMYTDIEGDMEPGDIVSAAFGTGVLKATAGQSSKMMGVVSTNPGIVLGLAPDQDGRGQVPVALAGRVPLKVNDEGGPIRAGDRITISSVPGVGMRSASSSETIAMALEPFDDEGSGVILAYVTKQSVGQQPVISLADIYPDQGSISIAELDKNFNILTKTVESFDLRISMLETSISTSTSASLLSSVWDAFKNFGVVIEESIASFKKIFAEEVTTKKLCLEEVCLSKEELKLILEGANKAAEEETEEEGVETEGSEEVKDDSQDQVVITVPVATSTDEVLIDFPITPIGPEITIEDIIDSIPSHPTSTDNEDEADPIAPENSDNQPEDIEVVVEQIDPIESDAGVETVADEAVEVEVEISEEITALEVSDN